MLVSVDAASLEWRLAVEFAKDPVGIREILDKLDIHSNNQTELELPSRLIAKIFLFRTIFRGSGWAFANDNDFKHVSTDPDFWDERNKRFYRKYSALNDLHRQWIEDVHLTGRITSFTGRFWEFQKRERKGKLDYSINEITNYPIQGTGADLIAIARISLKKRLTFYRIPSILVSTVHDSIIVDIPEKSAKDVAKIMHDVFNDLPANVKKLFKYELSVPFPGETKIGKNLLEMETYEP